MGYKIKITPSEPIVGDEVFFEIYGDDAASNELIEKNKAGIAWEIKHDFGDCSKNGKGKNFRIIAGDLVQGPYTVRVQIPDEGRPITDSFEVHKQPAAVSAGDLERLMDRKSVRVELQSQSKKTSTDFSGFVEAVINRTEAISFKEYDAFITEVLCGKKIPGIDPDVIHNRLDRYDNNNFFQGVRAYELLKEATDLFLVLKGAAEINESCLKKKHGDVELDKSKEMLRNYLGKGSKLLPYLGKVVTHLVNRKSNPYCDETDILVGRLEKPMMIELWWSYAMEESMVVQAMNAVSFRFQNKRISRGRDPLAHLTLSPLRPMSNLLFGFLQDEHNRLTCQRRSYEYQNAYGVSLLGKAVPKMETVESRSNFMEAFNNLLHRCSVYYQELSDKTVEPDTFPLLNAIKEVHLQLSEGSFNQIGDLTFTSRSEILSQCWLLSRKEMGEFLHGRPMTSYPEPWMGHVETIKGLMGWINVSVRHFYDLAVRGERLLLTIRYGDWANSGTGEDAKDWANLLKQDVQTYINAYHAITGVNLSVPEKVDGVMPGVHIQRRLAKQGMLTGVR